ncbi:CZB domain-containing protein [Hydrogenophaga sp. A37]|uniref:CZB domain-containing protein n=1 Tax=Hydrogenophaga sp. A37 TaxID=1945864 RepID=UPI0009847678|nr:CZB domain-containing protein [Hydrogenophaga sp. A37]OOG86395.1 hypothetical protein B0E41_06185 [Hydrogenophaga sp. A37]
MNLQQLLARLPWPRSRTGQQPKGPAPARAPVPAPEPVGVDTVISPLKLDRLDVQTAIIHHLEWCMLFNEHLSVDPAHASHTTPLPDAHQSALGHWLAKMRLRAAGGHPQFIELKKEHLRFHKLARQALDHAHNQRMDLASTLLNTEFERSRARVLDMLRGMQKG